MKDYTKEIYELRDEIAFLRQVIINLTKTEEDRIFGAGDSGNGTTYHGDVGDVTYCNGGPCANTVENIC